jgi:hypothetical protein
MGSKALVTATFFLLIGAGLTIAVFVLNRPVPPEGPAVPRPAPVPAPPQQGMIVVSDDPGAGPPPAPPDAAPPPAPPRPPPVPDKPAPPVPTPPRKPVTSKGMAVAETTLCQGVIRRIPQKPTSVFRVRDGTAWCFARLTGGAGRKVRTRWHLGGKTYNGIWLKAGARNAPSWRTWWSKHLDKTMVGEGRVDIVDEKGVVLATLAITVRGD